MIIPPDVCVMRVDADSYWRWVIRSPIGPEGPDGKPIAEAIQPAPGSVTKEEAVGELVEFLYHIGETGKDLATNVDNLLIVEDCESE